MVSRARRRACAALAAAAGRTLDFGIRFHVIARPTADEAWAAADALRARMERRRDRGRAGRLRDDAVGRPAAHGRRCTAATRDGLVVYPNVWAGHRPRARRRRHRARRVVRRGRRPHRGVPRARLRRVHPLRLPAPRRGVLVRRGRDAGAAATAGCCRRSTAPTRPCSRSGEAIVPMTRVGLLVVGHVDPNEHAHRRRLPGAVRRAARGPRRRARPLRPRRRPLPGLARRVRRLALLAEPARRPTTTYPWIADAEELHREIVAEERPYVGICFGHQLLAQALGGKVERAADGWGVGVQEYEIVDAAAVHGSAARTHRAASRATRTRSSTCRRTRASSRRPRTDTARSPGSPSASGRGPCRPIRSSCPTLADHLLAGRVELIGAERVARARASLTQPLDRATVARWIANFFVD